MDFHTSYQRQKQLIPQSVYETNLFFEPLLIYQVLS